MMLMQQQQQQGQGQGQAAVRGFSPPPNVTASGGMESPMGGPPMNQPGQQGFNYGGNYGELMRQSSVSIPPESSTLTLMTLFSCCCCTCRDEPAGGPIIHGSR